MKKFLTVFFTFTLYFNLVTQANAASVGGWSMSNPVAQGASVLYNGAKNVIINGKNVAFCKSDTLNDPGKDAGEILYGNNQCNKFSFAGFIERHHRILVLIVGATRKPDSLYGFIDRP